jgi:hypothetical protein
MEIDLGKKDSRIPDAISNPKRTEKREKWLRVVAELISEGVVDRISEEEEALYDEGAKEIMDAARRIAENFDRRQRLNTESDLNTVANLPKNEHESTETSRPSERELESETAPLPQAHAASERTDAPKDIFGSKALLQLQILDNKISEVHRPLVDELQNILDHLTGNSFGSLESNAALATNIQKLMIRLGVRIECPKVGCHQPAMLHFRMAGTAKHGSFQFQHDVAGVRTRHLSSVTLPRLKLIPAPPDPRRTRAQHQEPTKE